MGVFPGVRFCCCASFSSETDLWAVGVYPRVLLLFIEDAQAMRSRGVLDGVGVEREDYGEDTQQCHQTQQTNRTKMDPKHVRRKYKNHLK